MLERMDYLIRLLQNSTEATFIIPMELFDENMAPQDKFEEMRRAYNILKKDDTLEILEIPLNHGTDNEKLEITIRAKQINIKYDSYDK